MLDAFFLIGYFLLGIILIPGLLALVALFIFSRMKDSGSVKLTKESSCVRINNEII